jgi:hypothetical protein
MWGGEDRGNSFSDFIDVISIKKECLNNTLNCNDSSASPIGNHHAGIDFTYTAMLFSRPISIYGQHIGEDKRDLFQITDAATLMGISSYLLGSKVYLEASDTQVECSRAGGNDTNCYYEHGTYTDGYRFYDRATGPQW